MQIEERLARVEAKLEALENRFNEIKFEDLKEVKQVVEDIRTKLNGYLEHRVKTILWSAIGKITISVLTSSAVISLLISLLTRR